MRREYFLLFLSPLVLVAIGVGYVQASRKAGTRLAEEVPGEALYREVLRTVRDRYVVAPDDKSLVYGAARGVISELDRHCRIYDDEEWAQHSLTSRGQYSGVGIVPGKLRGRFSVLEALPNGPAHQAGVGHGDRILAVDGEPIDDKLPRQALIAKLRGETGTEVVLRLAPLGGGAEREVRVKRGLTPRRLVYGYVLDDSAAVGYVHVESFRDTTCALFDAAIERLLAQGMKSVVLDLRGNLGGSLEAAIELTDRFISGGLIVNTAGRLPPRPRYAGSEAPYEDVPLIVVVDGHSASASEVVAGALQDHSRAVLLGERTFGKGVVQEVSPFRSGWQGGMKITTAHYFTPAGRCIERSVGLGRDARRRGGLVPDVSVAVTPPLRNRVDRLNWYARLDNARQRGRYAARVRAILEEEEPAFKDLHLKAAVALVSSRWNGDRPLSE